MIHYIMIYLLSHSGSFEHGTPTLTAVQIASYHIRLYFIDSKQRTLNPQVGGLGLTLTSADRVIVIDPSWNPASDAQAVDRWCEGGSGCLEGGGGVTECQYSSSKFPWLTPPPQFPIWPDKGRCCIPTGDRGDCGGVCISQAGGGRGWRSFYNYK